MASSPSVICAAIRLRRPLTSEYQGLPRPVAAYCHGISRRGQEVLRGVQVGGSSRSGLLGAGKLWLVAQMRQLRDAGESFVPNDPHYNPDDSALVEFHCRVRAMKLQI